MVLKFCWTDSRSTRFLPKDKLFPLSEQTHRRNGSRLTRNGWTVLGRWKIHFQDGLTRAARPEWQWWVNTEDECTPDDDGISQRYCHHCSLSWLFNSNQLSVALRLFLIGLCGLGIFRLDDRRAPRYRNDPTRNIQIGCNGPTNRVNHSSYLLASYINLTICRAYVRYQWSFSHSGKTFTTVSGLFLQIWYISKLGYLARR